MFLAEDMPAYVNIHTAVPTTVEGFQRLSVSDRLGLLLALNRNVGDSETASAPGSPGRMELSGTLTYMVASLPAAEQLQVMHDLVSGANTPITRSYGCLSSSNKLAFWHQLANRVGADNSAIVPADDQLSQHARAVFNQVERLEFNQKIAFLRLVVGKMGISPLVA